VPHTRHEPDLSAPIELGAEFIHGRVPETFELLHEVGKAALDTSGAHWTLRDGKLVQTPRICSAISRTHWSGRRSFSNQTSLSNPGSTVALSTVSHLKPQRWQRRSSKASTLPIPRE